MNTQYFFVFKVCSDKSYLLFGCFWELQGLFWQTCFLFFFCLRTSRFALTELFFVWELQGLLWPLSVWEGYSCFPVEEAATTTITQVYRFYRSQIGNLCSGLFFQSKQCLMCDWLDSLSTKHHVMCPHSFTFGNSILKKAGNPCGHFHHVFGFFQSWALMICQSDFFCSSLGRLLWKPSVLERVASLKYNHKSMVYMMHFFRHTQNKDMWMLQF